MFDLVHAVEAMTAGYFVEVIEAEEVDYAEALAALEAAE
jgi:hypothetical protein